MANYNEGENFVKMDWAMPFQRTGKFPIDRSSIFSTKADADLYASGGADSRGLGGTSYVGQIITVYENDNVDVYKINSKRKLEKLASSAESEGNTEAIPPTTIDDEILKLGGIVE